MAPDFHFSEPQFKLGMISPKNIKADYSFLVEDKQAIEQKKIEVDKNERERFDDLKKFIVTQIEKMEQSQGTHYVDLKELYEKKLISKIEHRNQSTLAPLKELVQTLKRPYQTQI